MNELMIVVILILLVSTVWGYFRGLLLTLFSAISWILAIALVILLAPYLTEVITPLLPEEAPTGETVYVIAFLIALVLLHVAAHALNSIIRHVPFVGALNKLAGLVFGYLRGAVIVWLMFAIIAMLATYTEVGLHWMEMIQQEEFLQWIYENNPLPTIQLPFQNI